MKKLANTGTKGELIPMSSTWSEKKPLDKTCLASRKVKKFSKRHFEFKG